MPIMIDALFNQTNYIAAKKLMDETVLRHEAIASNLANLETPNYKRIDVAPSFTAELKQALASGDPAQIAGLQPKLEIDSATVAGSRDGNTVQLESELAHMQQNTLAHALETQLISYSLVRMRLAITGKPV
jgi:flagellar basal-body rod protein FlgB